VNKSCFINEEKVKYIDWSEEIMMKSKTDTTTTEATTTEVVGTKSLKANSEVENFYRFIHENNLRSEAHTLIRTVMDRLHPKKRRKSKKIQ